MVKDERDKNRLGDEAPTWKHFVWVLAVVTILIALSWLAWFKFGWFH